jgi:ubiquinone/menaquinone biosynthesis C-methylase UbiE
MKTTNSKNISAFEAISKAQYLSCAPILFQTVYTLRNHNILALLDKSKEGLSIEDLCGKSDLSRYALEVLLEMALAGEIIKLTSDKKYMLTKVGYFLENDNMTRINFDFTKHVCYRAFDKLDEALTLHKPCGLSEFNENWETIYPHLSELPDDAKKAWFEWDHLYSQTSFIPAIDTIAELFSPKILYDVGGNTGKFAIECCKRLQDTRVTILDLPSQIRMAQENIDKNGMADRVDFEAVDILSKPELKGEADVWWMSQFLDCFAPEHIHNILTSILKVIKDGAHVCILEPIADRQKFDAAKFSINAGSLYFSAIANGYSRFFTTDMLTKLIEDAGFTVEKIVDNLGISNSMFICKKRV